MQVFFCFSAAISDKKSAAPALPLTLPNEILDEWKEIEKQSNLREKIKFWGKKGEEISDSKLRKLVHVSKVSILNQFNFHINSFFLSSRKNCVLSFYAPMKLHQMIFMQFSISLIQRMISFTTFFGGNLAE